MSCVIFNCLLLLKINFNVFHHVVFVAYVLLLRSDDRMTPSLKSFTPDYNPGYTRAPLSCSVMLLTDKTRDYYDKISDLTSMAKLLCWPSSWFPRIWTLACKYPARVNICRCLDSRPGWASSHHVASIVTSLGRGQSDSTSDVLCADRGLRGSAAWVGILETGHAGD